MTDTPTRDVADAAGLLVQDAEDDDEDGDLDDDEDDDVDDDGEDDDFPPPGWSD